MRHRAIITRSERSSPIARLVQSAGLTVARFGGMKIGKYVPVQLANKLFNPDAITAYGVAYTISPAAYACVSLIAETVATLSMQLFVGEGDERQPMKRTDGNALDRWLNPNPYDDCYTFTEALAANLMVFGTSFVHKDRMGQAPKTADGPRAVVRELNCLNSECVMPLPGPRRTIKMYKYLVDGDWLTYQPEDVCMIRLWNPNPDDPRGLSPMSAAMLGIESKRNLDKFLNASAKTGGGMPGIFSVKEMVSNDQRDAFLNRIREKWKSVERMMEPDFFPADMTFQAAANTLAEMEFVETQKLTTAEIARIYRVPPVLVGMKEGGGLSDAGATTDMLLFWEHRIKPLLTRIQRALDKGLWPEWYVSSGTVTGEFDLSRVLPLVSAYLEQAKGAVAAAGTQVLLVNETRKRLGDRPLDSSELQELKDQAPTPAPLGAGAGPDAPNAGGPRPTTTVATPPKKKPASQRLSRESLVDAGELQLERASATAERLWRSIIEGQFDRMVARMRDLYAPAKRVIIPELEDILSLIEDEHDRKDVSTFLQRLVEATGQGAIDIVPRSLLAQALTFDLQARAVRIFLKEHEQRAIAMPNETTKRQLRIALADLIQQGAGMDELARAVQDVRDVRIANTATIARTESLAALNFAAIEGYKQTGVVDEMEWATSRDEVVRGLQNGAEWDHVSMDGSVTRIGELWTVRRVKGGFETLRHPGDPKGSTGNIINCRCRTIPRFAASAVVKRTALWFDRAAIEGRHRATPLLNGTASR